MMMLSKRAREYRHQCAAAAIQQTRQLVRFTGPVKVIIALTAPDQRKRDLDNFAGKALLDVLTHLGVWDDDSQVHDLHSWWADKPRKPGQAVITIEDL